MHFSWPSNRIWKSCLLLGLLALAARCDSHHGPTDPGNGRTLAILCPVNQAVDDLTNAPAVPVNFPAAATTGGDAPVAVQCDPASGATFPVGATPVTCNASDAGGHVAACTFTVTVAPVPMLSLTSFMAFGDSLTEGEVQPQWRLRSPAVTDPAHGYPAVLFQLLQDRYKGQTITLVNEGHGGEHVQEGFYRLQEALDANQPESLILFEGINDLNDFPDHDNIPHIVDLLRDDIHEAYDRGVEPVFISTLTPQREPSPGGGNRVPVGDDLIRDTNEAIREMAESEGAIVVDGYAAIDADVATLVGADGLHLTVAGYQVLANAFFEAIRDNLELPPGTVPSDAAPGEEPATRAAPVFLSARP
jgi:lysophospholipase L1-like esterase